MNMSVLTTSILERAACLEEGGIISPKEFLHLVSRAAIDQAFTRLTKEGRLFRVGRGLYVAPVTSRFGIRPPAPEKVVAAVAHQKGEVVVSHSAADANALGLTTQVPVKEVFLSSGPSRTLHLGRHLIDARHAPRGQLILGTSRAEMAVRAMTWLGKEHLSEVLPKLRQQLPSEDWEKLTKGYFKTLIAIANKNARMLWAILAKNEPYDASAWLRHPMNQVPLQ
jgi:hypothetical protein